MKYFLGINYMIYVPKECFKHKGIIFEYHSKIDMWISSTGNMIIINQKENIVHVIWYSTFEGRKLKECFSGKSITDTIDLAMNWENNITNSLVKT
jgi:hypothetical protein